MSHRHRGKSGGKRAVATRKIRRYLIVAEDSKSSLDYLKSFPHNTDLVQIVPHGGAGNTLSVVKKGIELRDEAAAKGEPFVHVYCVFDKDDFQDDDYHNAVDKARSRNDVSAIWSNECFELWDLLHFVYRSTGIGRHDLYREVSKHIEKSYDKADKSIYGRLLDRQDNALRNARRLYVKTCELTSRPWMENPCTNVHILVETLRKLKDISSQVS